MLPTAMGGHSDGKVIAKVPMTAMEQAVGVVPAQVEVPMDTVSSTGSIALSQAIRSCGHELHIESSASPREHRTIGSSQPLALAVPRHRVSEIQHRVKKVQDGGGDESVKGFGDGGDDDDDNDVFAEHCPTHICVAIWQGLVGGAVEAPLVP